MTSKRLFIFLVFVLTLWEGGYPQAKSKSVRNTQYDYLPGQIICKFKTQPSPGSLRKSVANLGLSLDNAVPLFPSIDKNKLRKSAAETGLARIYQLQVDENGDIPLLCARLESSGLVEYAEPNYLFPVEAVPNDSLWETMWHLQQVRAPEAWDVTRGDSSVVIAIVDTGVDWDHPDLAAAIWSNPNEIVDGIDNDGNGYVDDIRGWDFVERVKDYSAGEDGIKADNNPMDFDGHGSFVAGVAAAVTNNHIGVSSLSWGCRLMPLRAGYHALSGGYIVLAYAARAFVYAADNGADVINLSTASSQVLADAARYAYERGLVITKSAGNDRSPDPDAMELEPYVLSTAAVNQNDELAGYSDYGRWVKIAAPGGQMAIDRGLTSTWVDGFYRRGDGTSYAAPVVAALAGLLKSQYPSYSASDIIFQITETADNVDDINPAFQGLMGHGRINAFRAVTEAALPQPKLSFAFLDATDVLGNGDGRINGGETIDLAIQIKNSWGDAHQLSGTIHTDAATVDVLKSGSTFDDIPGISDIQNNSGSNKADPFTLKIKDNALPHIVPMVLTLSGATAFSQTIPFSLPVNPSLLLVDDDGDDDFEKYYLDALSKLNCSYELYNTQKSGLPPRELLQRYDTIIWFCGQTGPDFATLDAQERRALAEFLDGGGQLFLSGQDIGWDLSEDLDPSLDANNQYQISGGDSKLFYEQYLKAQYIQDDAGKSSIAGYSGDPISDGLNLAIDTPGNGTEYPSVIKALAGSVPLFQYGGNQVAAIRYGGGYRLVYFAFGGIESILDPAARILVLQRVLQWLNGVSVEHQPLPDTDNTSKNYVVKAVIETGHKPLKNTALYWKLVEEQDYHISEMTTIDGLNYRSEIPAIQAGTLQYGIVSRLSDDTFVPFQFYSFRVAQDETAPTILASEITSSPFAKTDLVFSAAVTDDLNRDGMTVTLDYQSNSGVSGQLSFNRGEADSLFHAELGERFFYGDSLFYVIRATDGSPRRNTSELAPDTLVVGFEPFDNTVAWLVESGMWGLDRTQKRSGDFSLNDSPQSEINTGLQSIIKLAQPLDLSNSKDASLTFWTLSSLRRKKDIGYVEASVDGKMWTVMTTIRGTIASWKRYFIPLTAYAGLSAVSLRFRLATDKESTFAYTGWYIDDLFVREQRLDTQLAASPFDLPRMFTFSPNYPNPFNPSTQFKLEMPEAGFVEISVFNTLGQKVKMVTRRFYPPGLHLFRWDATDDTGNQVPAGIYYVRVKAGQFNQARKVAFVK